MYKIVCSRSSKQVWNLSASEVSQDQQFWDATVLFPMSPSGLCLRGQEAWSRGVAQRVLQRLQVTQSTIVS